MPLHAACHSGSNGVVFALVSAGASVHTPTPVSGRSLYVAVLAVPPLGFMIAGGTTLL